MAKKIASYWRTLAEFGWLLVILLSGCFFRFYRLSETVSFGWDQVFISAKPSWDIIINHHYPLIGAQTSVGELFVGPLYSYISAPVYALFGMDPTAGGVVSALLGLLAITIFFLSLKHVFSLFVASLASFFLACSPYIVMWDRIPWNVNLILPSAVLFFHGIFLILYKKKAFGYLWSGLGLALYAQSHFTVIFFVLFYFCFALYKKSVKSFHFLLGLCIFFLSIMPLVIFDIRHHFMLVKNAFGFFSFGQGKIDFLTKGSDLIQEFFLFTGNVFAYDHQNFILALVALLFYLILIIFINLAEVRKLSAIFFFLLTIFLTGFTMYGKATPEYYFLAFAPLIFSLAGLVIQRFPGQFRFIIAVSIIFYLMFQTSAYVHRENKKGLAAKKAVVETLLSLSADKRLAVNYDMDLSMTFGFDYLFRLYGIKLIDDSNRMFWVTFPRQEYPGNADVFVNDFAIGKPEKIPYILKSRTERLFNNTLFIRIPNNISLTDCTLSKGVYVLSPSIKTSCGGSFTDYVIISLQPCIEHKERMFTMKNGTCVALEGTGTFLTSEILHQMWSSLRLNEL